MIKLLKWIFCVLKFNGNTISFSSLIISNSTVGKRNKFFSSYVQNSELGSDSVYNSSSIVNSKLGDQIVCGPSTRCFSVNVSNNVLLGSDGLVSESTIGKYTYLSGRNRIFNADIGKFCSIAEDVVIGHAEHPTDFISTSPLFYKKENPFGIGKFVGNEFNEFHKTIIGNDIWIGAKAYIKGGVRVGDGAIIGTGAVVTKDVPPFTIVAGVPAKEIRKRFSVETILQLQSDPWWEWDELKLEKERYKLSSIKY